MAHSLRILADENIPMLEETFGQIGHLEIVPAASIVPKIVRGVDVLLVRSVTKVNEGLLKGSKVQFVGTATTGIDHIDLDYLKQNGISFASAHGANATSVVEYVLAALFHLSIQKQESVFEKTVGIIGCGCIGAELVKRLSRMGIKVLQNDPIRQQTEPYNSHFVDLDTLLRAADVVSLHVPLNATTVHLVDDEALQKMKSGAWLIHTCRGGVVDEAALIANQTKFGALVLDVWEDEPNINQMLLAQCDIATPHIAGYSYQGKTDGTQMIYEALCRHLGYAYNLENKSTYPSRHALVGGRIEEVINRFIESIYPILTDNLGENCSAARFVGLRKQYWKRASFKEMLVFDETCPKF